MSVSKQLQAQAQKQQEAHTQLKAYIEDEIQAVHQHISAQIRDSQLGLKTYVETLGRNIQDLKDALRCRPPLCSHLQVTYISWLQLCPSVSHGLQLLDESCQSLL